MHSQRFGPTLPSFYLSASKISPPATVRVAKKKPELCTADELHYVPVSSSDWKLALWRYLPSPLIQRKNHPLLLLSGVGTNAIGFDLAPPESSLARFMSGHGFDTWILELRGAGFSALGMDSDEEEDEIIGTVTKSKKSVSKLSEALLHLFEGFSGLFEGQNPAISIQIKDFARTFVNVIEEGQQSVKPPFFDFPERFSTALDDFLKQLELLVKYDWDFDHYLEEDLPAAIEYIREQSQPKDGKLLAVGHSMGGMLLYAMLSRCASEGRDSSLTSIATLASSLDFRPSKSSLKLLLPVAKPVKTLNFPVIPFGTLVAAARPYSSRPSNALPWLNSLISAPGMMHPELFEKLVAKNFCTIPAKLILQLKTVFEDGGLRSRDGTFSYKHHLRKCNIPVLAIAGDHDLICPPEAVYETAKVIPKHLVTYRVFGEPKGPHYAHYDLVGSHMAQSQVHPCIIDFLNHHDLYG
ncbi:hypothetical protein M5689_004020 [Euphorbia peplus]|nr:hypothetical protein M5689_004020 [Euphorbia peplus]